MSESHHGHGLGGDPVHREHHGPPPLRRLIAMLRLDSSDLWLVVIFAAGIGLLSLATPITLEALVSNVQGGNQAMFQVVVVLSLILFFCLSLAGGMRAYSTFIVELIQRRIFVRVVAELAYRLPRVQVRAFDRQHGPELVNRFFDVLTVQKAGATLMLDGVSVVIQAFIGLLVLSVWHPYLLGYNLVLLLALVFMIWLLGIGAISTKIRESFAKYAVAGWLEEMVRHPLAFKPSAGQHYAMNRADALTEHYLETRIASFRILYRQILFSIALQAIASSALFTLGGWLVVRNELTIGQLVAAELIVTVLVGSFVKLGKSLESFYDLMAAMDKLGHLLDLPLEREEGELLPESGRPASLEIHNLRFHYEDGNDVFHGLTVSIRPGERVALVGESGVGKSTLLDILMGLREPGSGYVTIDGIDLRDLQLEDLRRHVISVAGEEAFAGTILDNVRLGRPEVSLLDVRQALETVCLMQDIQTLPQGLHTPLNTGGAPLSDGQTKRLMLARALASKPRLLLLDESLDLLDPPAKRSTLAALCDRNVPWTLIIVTRDPDILAACDRTIDLTLPEADQTIAYSTQDH